MGDKHLGGNNFFQVDADKDLLNDFLNAESVHGNEGKQLFSHKSITILRYTK